MSKRKTIFDLVLLQVNFHLYKCGFQVTLWTCKMMCVYFCTGLLIVFLPTSRAYISQYIGCYKDYYGARALSGASNYDLDDSATIPACIDYCKERAFTYAGVEYHDECFCGESYNRHGEAEESSCNTKCKGDGSQICGGANRISVYTVCPFGDYGSDCGETCSEHCLEERCRFNGSCFTCDTGYLGSACDTICSPGFYGDNCKKICSGFCKTPPCIPTSDNGECPGKVCELGYKGNNCSTECEAGEYGENCKGQCSEFCRYKPCVASSVNGTCLYELCVPGYQGPSCTEKCEAGTFGENCTGECSENCKYGPCVATSVDGICLNQTCLPGYQAPYCTDTCSNGTYGDNCTQRCTSCTLGCNPVTGECVQQECKQDQIGCTLNTEQEGNSTPIIVTLVLVFLVILISITVALIIVRRRKEAVNDNKSVPAVRIDNAGNGSHLYEEEPGVGGTVNEMVDNEVYEGGSYVGYPCEKKDSQSQDEHSVHGMVDNELYEENNDVTYENTSGGDIYRNMDAKMVEQLNTIDDTKQVYSEVRRT